MNEERIAELLTRIAHKDQKIYELTQELKVKDEIIRKQVVMMSELQRKPDGEGAVLNV